MKEEENFFRLKNKTKLNNKINDDRYKTWDYSSYDPYFYLTMNEDEFQKHEEESYKKINLEIFIYVLKSPCTVCESMYENVIEKFTSLTIHVFYSKLFKYENKNIIHKVAALTTTGRRCFNQHQYRRNWKNLILECINNETKNKINQQTLYGGRLTFKQIAVQMRKSLHVKHLLKAMKLYENDN